MSFSSSRTAMYSSLFATYFETIAQPIVKVIFSPSLKPITLISSPTAGCLALKALEFNNSSVALTKFSVSENGA